MRKKILSAAFVQNFKNKENIRGKRCKPLENFIFYCRISTLPALRKIAAKDVSWVERIIWLTVFVVSFGLTVFLMVTTWQKLQETPMLTTIESIHHSIATVPFPAVTVCNNNGALRSSTEVIIEKFVAEGINRSLITQFLTELPHFLKRYGYQMREDFGVILVAMHRLGFNLNSLSLEISQPCSRLLKSCRWLGKYYKCSEMFEYLATQDGVCCSFNWHGKPIEYTPELKIRGKFWGQQGIFKKKLYVKRAGAIYYGLLISIDPEVDNQFSNENEGASIIIHHHEIFPSVSTPRTFVQPNFQTTIKVTSEVIGSADNVRELRISQRKCYFEDEAKMKTSDSYKYENCKFECRLHYFRLHCGCAPYYYPKFSNDTVQLPVCNMIHKNCTDNYIASYPEMPCICLPSCTDISYEATSEETGVDLVNFKPAVHSANRSQIAVFFKYNNCIKYRRISQISWDSLVASFGGLLGLYLSSSILSVLELLYFLTYKIWQS